MIRFQPYIGLSRIKQPSGNQDGRQDLCFQRKIYTDIWKSASNAATCLQCLLQTHTFF